jgi:cytochrome P450
MTIDGADVLGRGEAEAVVEELFHTPEGRRDPHPRYHRLRELAPVHRSATLRGWLLTRYHDCHAALRDPRLQNHYEEVMDARSSRWRRRPGLVWAGTALVNRDGPVHADLRRRVAHWFTPRKVARLRPLVEAVTDELLDTLAEDAGGELMERLAFPLPVGVIGRLLGMPPADLPPFRDRILSLTGMFELGCTPEMLDAADRVTTECREYFERLVAEKRAHPDDDLLTHLAGDGGAHAGARLSDAEISDVALFLLLAGYETTTNLIGSGVLALLDHPEQLDLLRRRPDRCPGLVDELLRHGSSVQIVSRVTTDAIAFGETVIPAGEQVFPLLGAANRDPARYPDPDRLDLTRPDIRPLAFGSGLHYCLGAELARLEIAVVFHRLVERFDDIRLEGARAPYRDRLSLPGPTEVPVRLRSRRTPASSAER